MTGCTFAKAHASAARVHLASQLEELAPEHFPQIDAFFDGAGAEGKFAALVFPRVRSAQQIVRLLRVLAEGERWSCTSVPWQRHARGDEVLVGLSFRTSEGLDSSVMGFAPLGCMPVTRRAPYVALALWSGPKASAFKATPGNGLGFVDMPAPTGPRGGVLGEPKLKKMWEDTKSRVRQLLGDPPEDPITLRRVAFCLPSEYASNQFEPAPS